MSKVQRLKRLKSRLAGEADASVETPFEIQCDCGAVVRGVRRATAIQKDCDRCGEWLYVLPANVYPATKTVHSEVIAGGFAQRLAVIVGEIFPAKQKPDERKEPGSKSKESSDKKTAAEDQPGPIPAKKRWIPKLSELNPRRVVRKVFTPFRLVMLSIVAIIGLTSFWLSNKRASEEAQQVWLTTPDLIEKYVDQNDYVELENVLANAVDAGERLGKTDPELRYIKNFRNEVAAANQLSSTDLLSAFQSAYDKQGQLLQTAADTTPDRLEGYFIFDTVVADAYTDPDALQCELPAAPGRHAVNCIIRIPAIKDLLATIEDSRLIFAAKFSSVSAPGSTPFWSLEVDSESFAFVTSRDVCETIGLSVLDYPDLTPILERQEAFVRTSDRWDKRLNELPESED